MDQPHQRRKRYSGSHPKHFDEKYKELNPQEYSQTAQKVIQKGSTPAGTHRPICVQEILDFFDIHEGQRGLDVTLGYGGHTVEMLQRLNHSGHLVALDVDPIEMPKTIERIHALGYDDKDVSFFNINFSKVSSLVESEKKYDFILADLGVSSMQIDNPARGFTFKAEGPLDLRMNPEKGIPAKYRLKDMSEDEIKGMLVDNADEPYADKIASGIIKHYRSGGKINTTTELKDVITASLQSLPYNTRSDEIKKACQRTFQAIRIDVNHEYEALYQFLDSLPSNLNPGGKVAILTFHSGEDRLVKKSFQQYFREGLYELVAPEPLRASMEEQSSNPRSKSAKLRWAIKK